MGLLTISRKLEEDHPEIISMAIRWLKKECNAKILYTDIGVKTDYYIEGESIPKGEEKFDLIFKKIVPQVFSISIRAVLV